MSFEAEMRCLRAHSETAGIMIATTGVLFRKADTRATGAMSRACAPATVPGRPRRRVLIHVTAPVSRMAPATTYSAAMVATASLPKPARASAGVRTPAVISSASAPTNTASAGRRVATSAASAERTIALVRKTSMVGPMLPPGGGVSGGHPARRHWPGGRDLEARTAGSGRERPDPRDEQDRHQARGQRHRDAEPQVV